MKKIFIFTILITLIYCGLSCVNPRKKNHTIKDLQSISDSLKTVLEISDSIKILKVDTIQKSIAFIDYNKNSKFHKILLLQRGNNIYPEYYNEEFLKQKDQIKTEKPNIPGEIVKKWIQLYKFDSQLYVYLDCEYQMVYQTTDSTFISYYMDGGMPDIIIDYKKLDKTHELVTFKGDTIKIEQVDNGPIFQIKWKKECKLYTPSDQINNFSIIVHHCTHETDDLISFEEYKCK